MGIPELAAALNVAAGDYEIGQLQSIRGQLHGLRRVSTTLFSNQSTFENYAFHAGARNWSELQFNIGVEHIHGEPVVRHSVAFSLQQSRTVPSIDPFREKILRFNDYVRSNPEDFSDLYMWDYQQRGRERERSPDRPVTPIDESLIENGAFIVLGRWVPAGTESVQAILEDFDRLLPLWRYVESVQSEGRSRLEASFEPGCPKFLTRTMAAISDKTVDVALRHKYVQIALYKELCREHKKKNVRMEHPLEFGVYVDGAVRNGSQLEFYEVKIAPTVQSCVRAALGQLLEYAFWPDSDRAMDLIIVGEQEPDDESRMYLQYLRDRFSLPVWYRRMDVVGQQLGPKT